MKTCILWNRARKTGVAGLVRLWHAEALVCFISEDKAPCASLVLPSDLFAGFYF